MTRIPIFLLSLLAFSSFGVSAPAESFPANAVRRLALDIAAGNVSLTATEENTVTVSADGTLETSLADGALTIRRNSDANTPITVAAPFDTDVSARLERGELRLERLSGAFDLHVKNGAATILGATGVFDVTVETGNIQARVFLNGTSLFQTERGDLTVEILDEVSYPLAVKTNVGDITLTVPEDYGAELYATTEDGSIRSRVPVDLVVEQRPNDERRKRLTGILGDGGDVLTVATERGNIEIRPFDAPEAEPSPFTGWLVPKARTMIRVDGQLEAAWLDAPILNLPYADAGDYGEAQFLWDDTHLYLAFFSRESDWNPAMAGIESDSPVLNDDDTIDLYVFQGDLEFRVAVNPIGTVLDTANGDKTWESGAVARTALYSTGWILEMAIPRKSLPEIEEFAVVRSVAHSREEFEISGVPAFEETAPSDESRVELNFDGDAANRVRPLLTTLGYLRNGEIRVADIPLIERNLTVSGGFGGVNIALSQEEGQAHLLLSEPDAPPPYTEIEIVGASEVPVSALRERFSLTGSIGTGVAEHRRMLVESAYSQWGYSQARVSLATENSRVTFQVDEGIIGGLRVEGTKRVPETAVVEALQERIGKPYHAGTARQTLNDAAGRLSQRHKELRRLEDAGVTIEDDIRVWTVRIVENPPLNRTRKVLWNFTRVHGFEVGLENRLQRGEPSRYEVVVGGSFLQEIRRRDEDNLPFNYHAGFFGYQNDSRTLGVGGEWRRATHAHPWQGNANPLSTLLAGGTGQDYFSAEGGQLFARARFHPRFVAQAGFGVREDASLFQTVPWSVLKRKGFRGNRAFSDGRLQYGRLTLSLDRRDIPATNDDALHPQPVKTIAVRKGFWTEIVMESGLFDPLDFSLGAKRRATEDYGLIRGDLRAYLPLGTRAALDSRARGQWSDSRLPAQLQMWVGSGDTIRSLTDGNWHGDSGWVWNIEARVQPTRLPVWVGVFADVGKVWFRGPDAAADETLVAGGVALEADVRDVPESLYPSIYPIVELLRAEVAFPILGDVKDAQGKSLSATRLRLLISRPF